MVSALVSGSSGPSSSPGRGHCVVFLGKTLNSHCAIRGGCKGGPKTAKPHRNTPKTANRIGFFPEYRNRTSSSLSAATSTTSVVIVAH